MKDQNKRGIGKRLNASQRAFTKTQYKLLLEENEGVMKKAREGLKYQVSSETIKNWQEDDFNFDLEVTAITSQLTKRRKFINELKKSGGFVSIACKKIGIEVYHLIAWVKKYSDFKEQLMTILDGFNLEAKERELLNLRSQADGTLKSKETKKIEYDKEGNRVKEAVEKSNPSENASKYLIEYFQNNTFSDGGAVGENKPDDIKEVIRKLKNAE